MKDGLISLLVRRTEQGRSNAQAAVEDWNKAITTVAEASGRADCPINLPSNLTNGVMQATQNAKSADYVSAVSLLKNAKSLRQQIIAYGLQQLEQEVNTRSKAVADAQDAIENAKRNHATALKKLESQKIDYEMKAKHIKAEVDLPKPPSGCTAIGSGCGTSIICVIIACLMSNQLKASGQTNITFMNYIIATIGILGLSSWIVIPIVLYIANALKRTMMLGSASKNAAAMLQKTQDNYKTQTAEEMQRFEKMLPPFERTYSQTEVRRQKAEQAFQWLKAQT